MKRKKYRKPLVTHTEKPCSLCKEVKPIEEFHKDSTAPDMKCSQCKRCAIATARKAYLKKKK